MRLLVGSATASRWSRREHREQPTPPAARGSGSGCFGGLLRGKLRDRLFGQSNDGFERLCRSRLHARNDRRDPRRRRDCLRLHRNRRLDELCLYLGNNVRDALHGRLTLNLGRCRRWLRSALLSLGSRRGQRWLSRERLRDPFWDHVRNSGGQLKSRLLRHGRFHNGRGRLRDGSRFGDGGDQLR